MRTVIPAAILLTAATGVDATAQTPAAPPITCRSVAGIVKAATIAAEYFPVTTRSQVDQPPLQPMLATSFTT